MRKDILVGTMVCGEAERDDCLAALELQQGITFDCFEIENLPNKAAHDALYKTFMERSGGYDYFLKLDADMVLRGKDAARTMLDTIKSGNYAVLAADVFDWPSQLSIPAIQMFRSECEWNGSNERLNVDYPPIAYGKTLRAQHIIPVDHMPNPNAFQCFRYGVHKALKAIQPDRDTKNLNKGIIHAAILSGIARHRRLSKDNRLSWSLIGATAVFRGEAKELVYDYSGTTSKMYFDAIDQSAGRFETMAKIADEYWESEIRSYLLWSSKFSNMRYEDRAAGSEISCIISERNGRTVNETGA